LQKSASQHSNSLEKYAFRLGLLELINEGLEIAEVTTDNHLGIGKLMREDNVFKNIPHTLDSWHVAKNLNKKLTRLGQTKGFDLIALWKR
jgi:hypothetical protein